MEKKEKEKCQGFLFVCLLAFAQKLEDGVATDWDEEACGWNRFGEVKSEF